jgi:protein O-mannosyl-transferase
MPNRKKPKPQHLPAESALASATRFNLPAAAALIALAALLVYFPALNGRFIWDDEALLGNIGDSKISDGLYKIWCTARLPDYWPVTNSAFRIQWQLWGTNPAGYHVTNLVLHIAESLLIWIVLRRLSIPGALLAAILFAVHPVNVESVAWIAQLKNAMSMLFFLLSILWYLRFIEPIPIRPCADKKSHPSSLISHRSSLIPDPSSLISHPSSFSSYCLSLLAFTLAMLGKGSVAVLPLLFLGIIWWRGPVTRRDLLQLAPFFLIAAALTAVNIYFQAHIANVGDIRTVTFTQRMLGAGAVIWFYLYKAILPLNLAFIYPRWHIPAADWLWWLPLVAALLVTVVLWCYRKRWARPLLFAWAFFGVALAPAMGFADVGLMRMSLVADHYQHIAIIGVTTLAAASWSAWRGQVRAQLRPATLGIPALAICSLAFLAGRQSALYRDSITMYRDVLQKNPECWAACDNLGEILLDAGQTREAIVLLEKALAIKPDCADAHLNLGKALVITKSLPEAIDQFKLAIQFEPDNAVAFNNLAGALFKSGQTDDAIEMYRQALRLQPNYIGAYHGLASVYARLNRPDDAIAIAEEALEVARSQGNADLVRQIEDWLKSYRANLPKTTLTP